MLIDHKVGIRQTHLHFLSTLGSGGLLRKLPMWCSLHQEASRCQALVDGSLSVLLCVYSVAFVESFLQSGSYKAHAVVFGMFVKAL